MRTLVDQGKEDRARRDIGPRVFLKSCLAAALAALAGSLSLRAAFAAPAVTAPAGAAPVADALEPTARPDHVTLSWTSDPHSTMTITWRTSVGAAAGEARLVEAGLGDPASPSARSVAADASEMATERDTMLVHSATLTGLKPGTKYAYRVGAKADWSQTATFATEPSAPKAFKFLIFGDTQSGDGKSLEYGPWKADANAAWRANPDAAFMVVLGDLVEVGQSMDHWNRWFDAAKGVIDHLPLMSVLGNHETYGKSVVGGEGYPTYYLSQFRLPENGPANMKRQAYAFDYGNAHLDVLDSQFEEESQMIGGMPYIEADWLDRDLSTTTQAWKLAFFHKSYYPCAANRPNADVRTALAPAIDKHHVDLVFNGHDHCYARSYPIKGGFYAASPAKGTVYTIAGHGGAKSYPNLRRMPWDAAFDGATDQPDYLVVEVAGDKLTVKAFKQDGSLVDRYTIDKATDKDDPPTTTTLARVPVKLNLDATTQAKPQNAPQVKPQAAPTQAKPEETPPPNDQRRPMPGDFWVFGNSKPSFLRR
jgi:hypothetical protein